MKIANPIADSAAATIGTNKANNWPIISSKETEKTKKLKFTANNNLVYGFLKFVH